MGWLDAEDSTTDDSTTDDSTDDSGFGILPGETVTESVEDETDEPTKSSGYTLPTVLQEFAKRPIGFILGAILTTLLTGLETILEAFLTALQFVFEGDTVGSTEGMLGLADIPRLMAGIIGSAGELAGMGLTSAIELALDTLETAAGAAGPAAPLIIGIAFAGTIVTAAYIASFAWDLVKDTINPL